MIKCWVFELFSGLAERESVRIAFFQQEPHCYGVIGNGFSCTQKQGSFSFHNAVSCTGLEDLMAYCLHFQVQEVVKMMEVELGEGWILHKRCKV